MGHRLCFYHQGYVVHDFYQIIRPIAFKILLMLAAVKALRHTTYIIHNNFLIPSTVLAEVGNYI